jgi:hypothetical protein
MALTPSALATYLARYISAYREEYNRLTGEPPDGGGYPPLQISPYIGAVQLDCMVAKDGVAILDSSEPDHQWWIAGGPAMMPDFPDSRTPPEVLRLLKKNGLWGKPIGIYRLVPENGISDAVWRGELGTAIEEAVAEIGGVAIRVRRLDLTLGELIQRLTFGAFGVCLDIHLPSPDSDFWAPHIVRGIGFGPADRHTRRFVNYLELTVHLDDAAWDARAIGTRVQVDVRRDFALAFSVPPELGGGTLSFGQGRWIERYRDRLSGLYDAIKGMRELLRASDLPEDAVHEYLLMNPILLDVYGQAVSKPRLPYPEAESPLGKKYLEPDFIIRFPGSRYRLVELERPSKRLATIQGQPRAEVTQATFQIAEWRAYIANHYDVICTEFPGISTACTATIIISRSGEAAIGEDRDMMKYQELLRTQYPGIEILTYDELLERAQAAYVQLAALGVGDAPAV